jgi:4a-hydroxytetrahydrobiopterin dehydratase
VFRTIGDPDDRRDEPAENDDEEAAPGNHISGPPMHSTIMLDNSVGCLSVELRSRYVEEMAVLTDDQVDAALPDLNGWERADGALRRSIKFPAFLDGIDAVRRVAEKAEEKDHHPDIDIRWRTVTFALVTHSAGGITENDLQMAREINAIVGNP